MKMMLAAAGAAILMSCAGSASASEYTDELSRCLTSSTTAADRPVYIRWVFSIISAAEYTQPLSTITPSQREQFSREAMALMERLILSDCRNESSQVLRHDGLEAFGASFEILGRNAVAELMGDPAARSEMDRLKQYLDAQKWESFVIENQP